MPSIRSLILALPLIELALLIALAVLIGAGPTFLYVLGTGIVGALLLSVSRRAQTPGQPGLGGMGRLFQGGGMAFGGLLLLVPGLLTDLLGIVMLIPGPRTWLLTRTQRYMFKRITGLDPDQMPKPEDLAGFPGFGGFGGVGRGPGEPPSPTPPGSDGPPIIVDAEVTAVRDDPS